MRRSYLEQVFLGDASGPVSWVIRALLWPFSVIYRIGLAIYLWFYRSGIRKRCRLGVPVISVGNLTSGGTGKTPAVQSICRMLQNEGKKIAVLSRGHGGSAHGPAIASDGASVLSTSEEAGDEPILLARSLPGVPVIVGRDRRASGKLAMENFKPDAIVLDDGLQYWQLHRDVDVVVLNAKKPFGSGFVLPMGDLREPVTGLRRAGIVLLTNTASVADSHIASVREAVSRFAPGVMTFCAQHRPSHILDAETGDMLDLNWLAGRKVFAFCGIGHPDAFFESLRDLQAVITGSIVFPDHYRLSDRDITAIIDGANECGAEVILTTEKDLARMDDRRIPRLFALAITLDIEDTTAFAQYIADSIHSQEKPEAT